MNEKQIIDLLAERHSRRNDIFVSQCKTGPTEYEEGNLNARFPRHYRIDVWVMTRSWVNPCMIVYEVKSSRQDLFSDKKWVHYLKYCNLFYFAIPHGLLKKEEIKEFLKKRKCAGLIEATKNGRGLRVIAQPEHPVRGRRRPPFPSSLFKYVFFWRAEIR